MGSNRLGGQVNVYAQFNVLDSTIQTISMSQISNRRTGQKKSCLSLEANLRYSKTPRNCHVITSSPIYKQQFKIYSFPVHQVQFYNMAVPKRHWIELMAKQSLSSIVSCHYISTTDSTVFKVAFYRSAYECLLSDFCINVRIQQIQAIFC